MGEEPNLKTGYGRNSDQASQKHCKKEQVEKRYLEYGKYVFDRKARKQHETPKADVTREHGTSRTGAESRNDWKDTCVPCIKRVTPSPDSSRRKKSKRYASPCTEIYQLPSDRNDGWPVSNSREAIQLVCGSTARTSIRAEEFLVHNEQTSENVESGGCDCPGIENSGPSPGLRGRVEKEEISSECAVYVLRENDSKFASAGDAKSEQWHKKTVNFQKYIDVEITAVVAPFAETSCCKTKSSEKEVNSPVENLSPQVQVPEPEVALTENKQEHRYTESQVNLPSPTGRTPISDSLENEVNCTQVPDHGIDHPQNKKLETDKILQEDNKGCTETQVTNIDEQQKAESLSGETVCIQQGQISPMSQLTSPRSQPTSQRSQPTSQRSQPTSQRSQPTSQRSQPTSQRSQPTSQRSQPTSQRSQPTSPRMKSNLTESPEKCITQKSNIDDINQILPDSSITHPQISRSNENEWRSWTLKEYTPETSKKEETNLVKLCSNKQSIEVQNDNEDFEVKSVLGKVTAQHGKSLNVDTCFVPVTRNTSIEDMDKHEVPISPRHSDIHYGEKLNESDTESLDSRSIHLLRQLRMVQICKKKANILLKHVQSIIDGSHGHVKQIEPDIYSKKSWLKEQQYHASQQTKTNKSRPTSSERSSPSRTSKQISPKTVPVRNERHIRRHVESHKISPDKKRSNMTTIEYMSPTNENLLKSPVNMQDDHMILSWEEKGDNKMAQISGTPDFVTSEIQPGLSEQINNTAKYKYNNIQHYKSSEAVMVQKMQPCHRIEHPRSYYESGRKRGGRLLHRAKTPEVYAVKDPCFHRCPLDKGCVIVQQDITEPVAAFWTPRRSVNNPELGSNTSGSLESICVYNEVSQSRYQSGWNTHPPDDGLYTSIARRSRHYSHARSGDDSPHSYLFHTETTKSEHKSNAETKHIKTSKSTLKQSLKEAIKSANESITAAAKVAEVLSLAVSTSSSSLASVSDEPGEEYFIMNQEYHRKPKVHRSHNAKQTRPLSEPFHKNNSKYHYVQQPMETNNHQRNKEQHKERRSKKKRSSKYESKSQSLLASRPSPRNTEIFTEYPKHVYAVRTQRAFDAKPRHEHIISRKSLVDTERSPRAWRDPSTEIKRVPAADVRSKSCPENKATKLNAQTPARSPQITVHITFSKPPECSKQHNGNYLVQSSVNKKEKSVKDFCLRSGHLGIDHGLPTAGEYCHSSDLTLSQEDCTRSHSTCSCILKNNSFFIEGTPAIDPMLQNFPMPSKRSIHRQIRNPCMDGTTNHTEKEPKQFRPKSSRTLEEPVPLNNVYKYTSNNKKRKHSKKSKRRHNEEIYLPPNKHQVSSEQHIDFCNHQLSSFPSELNISQYSNHNTEPSKIINSLNYN